MKSVRKCHLTVIVAVVLCCFCRAFTNPFVLRQTLQQQHLQFSKENPYPSRQFASIVGESEAVVNDNVKTQGGWQKHNNDDTLGATKQKTRQLVLPYSASRLFSPYHILYPESFANVDSPVERYLPLDSCLRLLKQSLQAIIDRRAVFDDSKSDNDSSSSDHNKSVIRIEHEISHSVDPLCWLQAQSKSSPEEASMYFATADMTLDAAAYGSVKTFRGTVDDNDYWDLVQALPDATNLYGGQRFDVDSNTVGSEWTEFAQGFWMLPVVEIRREQQGAEVGKNATATSTSDRTTIALHLYKEDDEVDFSASARRVLQVLARLSDRTVAEIPPTTLPPVLSRASTYCENMDGQDTYERGVAAAIDEFDDPNSPLEKVVLARRMDLTFGSFAENNVNALDILRKWKFGNKPGGHLFYIRPSATSGEFFGCTPERLFQVRDGVVVSEALAGTRPRGSTQEADEELSRQLFASTKDQAENEITGNYILNSFHEMEERGWTHKDSDRSSSVRGNFFVRRLRHLQHICQRFQVSLADEKYSLEAIKHLLLSLHPTPAVGGYPKKEAMEFIRDYESVAFDRGFYAGPVGYISKDSAEIVVAIRSGLVTNTADKPKISVYAGAGIVPGSTVQGEWSETSYKLAVVSSIFPQSPITLQRSPTPNAAWAAAFVEELIRNGVTQFYICPGSRSTPFVAAIAQAARNNVNTVHAVSIHDERGAAFRALGHGRGSGHPAAVITSSGTAVANLYPAVVEAGMDGVPLLVLTADRPYENRASGANQAIDQVHAFSSTYVRWFRDILPPSDDVPVSVALSDAAHAVQVSREQRGPVHINVQFRENLAPDGGPIRNDNRMGSSTRYDGVRFTDSPGFQKWSIGGDKWLKSFSIYEGVQQGFSPATEEIAELILKSRRGIIVVGNLRKPAGDFFAEDISQTLELISSLAQRTGFPIFAGAQSANLRFISPAVIPYSEFLLRCPTVQDNISPDLVLQFGAPLVSTEIPGVIKRTLDDGNRLSHVLIHPHFPGERHDPELTVSHRVDTDIASFTKEMMGYIESNAERQISSELAPLVTLGRFLRSRIGDIVDEVSATERNQPGQHAEMTEPEIFMAFSTILSEVGKEELSLFLSNSMPVRDAELFLYPREKASPKSRVLKDIGVNRGASGIDGIIASAAGFSESTQRPTTLVIGDVAALHDVNSLHGLRTAKETPGQKIHPLTTIVINNDGGGIFSFLPISKHGSDVSFEEYFGTPTNTFSFEKGAEAFGLPFARATNTSSLIETYTRSVASERASVIEAVVAGRETNVAVHRGITQRVNKELNDILDNQNHDYKEAEVLPLKRYGRDPENQDKAQKTLVLLHGWMGDKSEWDEVASYLAGPLSTDWSIISIDLPGHGESMLRSSSEVTSMLDALALNSEREKASRISLDDMAASVRRTLIEHGVEYVDALAGYSLGGRVALALKRLCLVNPKGVGEGSPSLVSAATKLILVSTYPGDLGQDSGSRSDITPQGVRSARLEKDYDLSQKMIGIARKSALIEADEVDNKILWSKFLHKWYSAPLWGNLNTSHEKYQLMIEKRVQALSMRADDLAAALYQCSPPRCRSDDWRSVVPENTIFICGDLDEKYCHVGEFWSNAAPALTIEKKAGKGHALLVESSEGVAKSVERFLSGARIDHTTQENIRRKVSTDSDETPSLLETSRQPMTIAQSDKQDKEDAGLRVTEAIGSIEYESFSIGISDNRGKSKGIQGIGWGEAAKTPRTEPRKGFIIQVLSKDGARVGLGEVSPLTGLHAESCQEADEQLNKFASLLSDLEPENNPSFDVESILRMDGGIDEYLNSLSVALDVHDLLPSVRSGLEMALISLASQTLRLPIHRALAASIQKDGADASVPSNPMLPLNGLITRGSESMQIILEGDGNSAENIAFESWKVKIGFQSPEDDASAISFAFQIIESTRKGGKIRADANRAFDEDDADRFANALGTIGADVMPRFEYIEEPLSATTTTKDGSFDSESFATHVRALEAFYSRTALSYALDETLFDLATLHEHQFDPIARDIRKVLIDTQGCVALILKPSLLGLELSFRLARLAREELGIGAVFTSSFDSGIGLSYVSFLASLSDGLSLTSSSSSSSDDNDKAKTFAHGLGTFCMLDEDCLSPPFESYVNQQGVLNVASLSRAFYGLGLDEVKYLSISPLQAPPLSSLDDSVLYREVQYEEGGSNSEQQVLLESSDSFAASTATSSSGREITLFASLPLPFSADIACARFTDLPQQPRWSPWISSVEYVDAGVETEWTLRIRGVTFRWRAMSSLLAQPNKGIRWESKSGLKNTGVVEFIATGEQSSLMKLTMAIVVPRIVTSLFKGTSIFLEDFLRNKILKWSLEMFRDVVKGDLALEEGNVELGDALFGAVEGKASAIEATLSLPVDNNNNKSDSEECGID